MTRLPLVRWRRGAAAAVLALALPCGPGRAAPTATAPRQQQVLVLAPYAYGRPAVEDFLRIYVAGLVNGGFRRANIMVEYLNLDLEREGGQLRSRALRRDLIRERYRQSPPDLILAIQQPALDYLLEELRDLAPGAPVISPSVSTPAPALLGSHSLLLTPAYANVRATLQQALTLFPATEEVIVVVGTAPEDQKSKQEIAAAAAAMGLRARLEYTDALSLDGMAARVARAGAKTIVLTSLVNRDGRGVTSTPYDVWLRLARASSAPMFVLFSTTIGKGTLGGSVQHLEASASASASASLAILRGERTLAKGITRMTLPATNMYDWSELKRWDADASLLPPDTVFVNRPPTLWQQHRGIVTAALLVLVLSSMFSVHLLLQRRRLRMAESRYRVLVEKAPEAIVVFDLDLGRFVDANTKAERLFAISREELLRSAPERFYTDGQPDGLPPRQTIAEHAARGSAGEELLLVRTVCALDGRSFPCEVSVVALPSASGRLLRVGYVDISERNRVEQELRYHRVHLEDTVARRTAALSKALDDAQAAHRAKNVFLANMSHELRTPLNAIIGFSQMMASSTSMFDEEKQHLELIHRSGHQLLSMINDILELSRLEASRLQAGADAAPGGALSTLSTLSSLPTMPAMPVDALAWQALRPIGAAQQRALCAALQQLDLQQARALLADVRGRHGGQLADALDAMLAQHHYRELCALLERATAERD